MAKQTGLGDQLYVGGYDLSGDIGSIGSIHGGNSPIDVTAIDKSAYERVAGRRDGGISFNSYMNDSAGQAFARLKLMPVTDVDVAYFRGSTLGGSAAAMTAKTINYDPTRDADGSLTWATEAQGNGYGLEWGYQATAGKRTDTTATSPAAGFDTGGSTAFGAQAYLQVFAFTGTSVTVTLQDSANNSSFANISGGMAFAAANGISTQRITIPNTTTVRQYVRAITTGTFTNAVFAVVFVNNDVAGQVF